MLRHAHVVFLIVVACGAPAPRAEAVHVEAVSPAPALVPYFAIVSNAWVRSYVRAPDAEVEAWANDPANAKAIVPGLRHVLIRVAPDASATDVAAATKRFHALLARIEHGEDFATVANDSDDIGTRRSGGSLPATDLSVYVAPFRDAAQALAPGEVTKQPVRTIFGLHIVKRDVIDLEAKRAAYRATRAPTVARELAGEIVRTNDIDDALRIVLAPEALTAPGRPKLTAFATPKDGEAEDPACTHARERPSASVAALERGEGFVVVKPMTAAYRASSPPALCALESEDAEKIREALKRLKAQSASP